MNTFGRVLAWLGLGYVALVYIAVIYVYSTDPIIRETKKINTATMKQYDPRRVSFEEWKPVMHLWTDLGMMNFSVVMAEETRREVYEKIRHPWRARAKKAGQVFAGFAALGLMTVGFTWLCMALEERIDKKWGKM